MELKSIIGTTSPSGRYAIAWGIADSELGRKRNTDTGKVRNYLVERRNLSILGTIPLHIRYDSKGAVYKSAGSYSGYSVVFGKDQFAVMTYWSRNEDWVLILYDGRWMYDAVYLAHRTNIGFSFLEIGDILEEKVRAEIRRLHPQDYNRIHHADERLPYVDIDMEDPKIIPPILYLEITCHLGNVGISTVDFYGEAEMHITANAQGIQARLIKLHEYK